MRKIISTQNEEIKEKHKIIGEYQKLKEKLFADIEKM
jgi:hypothetical protein